MINDPINLPKNQCSFCGAWVSDETRSTHFCHGSKVNREKCEFPFTVEEVLVVWRENRGYVGLCDLGDFIKLYIWDGLSATWHEQYVFPKVDHKELMIKISRDPKRF